MAGAQRAGLAGKKHCGLEQGVVPPARAAGRNPPRSTPKNYRRLEQRGNTLLSRLDFGLALRTPPLQKKLSGHPHEGYKVTTSATGSGTAKERGRVSRIVEGADERGVRPMQKHIPP